MYAKNNNFITIIKYLLPFSVNMTWWIYLTSVNNKKEDYIWKINICYDCFVAFVYLDVWRPILQC